MWKRALIPPGKITCSTREDHLERLEEVALRGCREGPPTEKAWVTLRDAIARPTETKTKRLRVPRSSTTGCSRVARPYVGHAGSPLDLPARTLKAGVHGVPGGENMIVFEDDGGPAIRSLRAASESVSRVPCGLTHSTCGPDSRLIAPT